MAGDSSSVWTGFTNGSFVGAKGAAYDGSRCDATATASRIFFPPVAASTATIATTTTFVPSHGFQISDPKLNTAVKVRVVAVENDCFWCRFVDHDSEMKRLGEELNCYCRSAELCRFRRLCASERRAPASSRRSGIGAAWRGRWSHCSIRRPSHDKVESAAPIKIADVGFLSSSGKID